MKKIEIYEDVLAEEPDINNLNSKEYKKWEKRLHNSIGWIDIYHKNSFFVKKGKPISSPLDEEKIVYSVRDSDGGGMDFEDQGMSVIYSLLLQVNERLKRLGGK